MLGLKHVWALTLILMIYTSFLCHATSNNTCTDDEDRIFYRGEIYREKGNCVQYKCIGSDTWIGHDCPEFEAPPECKIIPGNLDKPYPKCCKTVTCKNDANDTVTNTETNPIQIKGRINKKLVKEENVKNSTPKPK